jgi:hypothetical protein
LGENARDWCVIHLERSIFSLRFLGEIMRSRVLYGIYKKIGNLALNVVGLVFMIRGLGINYFNVYQRTMWEFLRCKSDKLTPIPPILFVNTEETPRMDYGGVGVNFSDSIREIVDNLHIKRVLS